MPKTILITRETESAISTANKLLELGFAIKIAPLFEVKEYENIKREKLKDFQNVLISSKHAAKIAIKHNMLESKNIYVIGETTAVVLTSAQLKPTRVFTSSNDLLDIPLLHLCGEDSSITHLPEIKLYKYNERNFNKILNADIALVYSKRSAISLLKHITDIKIIAISEQVAQVFLDANYKKVQISSYPNEDNMIELLKIHINT